VGRVIAVRGLPAAPLSACGRPLSLYSPPLDADPRSW